MLSQVARCFIVAMLIVGTLVHADQPEPLPTNIDLREEFDRLGLTCRSQGNRSTCSLFAVTAIANFEVGRQTDDTSIRFSEEYLVWAADKATGRYGDQAMFYEALAGLEQLGICPEERFAYQRRGERAVPAEDVVSEAAHYANRWRTHWIKRWDARSGLDTTQWEAMRKALATGHPVACGLRWPRESGVDIMEVPEADGVFDGHSIAFVGYQDDPSTPGGGWLWLRNSHGANWGESGYGRMSYAYAQTYANDALWLEALPPAAQQPVVSWEAEDLEIVAAEQCTTSTERMNRYGSRMWSGRKQLACEAAEGASLILAFDVPDAGNYRVAVSATAAPHYGKITLELDGQKYDTEHNLYSGRVSPAGRLELPGQALAAGRHELKINVVGKSPQSRGYSFGIDTVEVLPPIGQ